MHGASCNRKIKSYTESRQKIGWVMSRRHPTTPLPLPPNHSARLLREGQNWSHQKQGMKQKLSRAKTSPRRLAKCTCGGRKEKKREACSPFTCHKARAAGDCKTSYSPSASFTTSPIIFSPLHHLLFLSHLVLALHLILTF